MPSGEIGRVGAYCQQMTRKEGIGDEEEEEENRRAEGQMRGARVTVLTDGLYEGVIGEYLISIDRPEQLELFGAVLDGHVLLSLHHSQLQFGFRARNVALDR
ncbi:hypothetical protein WR25_11726 [Diploscapter pachys]|uniref:Uncharacterized protein n=1 Tax=Diploscapter pachys TaxID=2018661 RepID=A0A2A2KP79_9BILA|nr:hypothetical protein WR25_11726 [Diploscapter pachys]